VALDRAGNIYFSDFQNGCVRKVGLDGRITTVGGKGIGGKLGCPAGLAINQRGELFVADPCKRQVLVVRNGVISAVGGIGLNHDAPFGDGRPAEAANFDQWGLTFDEQENLLITGPDFGHIYQISRDGKFHIIAGSGEWGMTPDGTAGSQATFQEPYRLAVDGAGNVLMTDRGQSQNDCRQRNEVVQR
jgi:hypothetical protein